MNNPMPVVNDSARLAVRIRPPALAAALALILGAAVPAATLRLSYQSDIATLDPQAIRETFTTEFLANIMEPLVRYDARLQPEPALAKRWERVSPTLWVFFLRRGVRFSNGNPFTADDVVFTFQRGSHPNSPLWGNISGIRQIRKVDDHTVEVDTHGPYPLVLRELTSLLIFDQEWVEEHGASAPADPGREGGGFLARHILGTGPFVVKRFQPGAQCLLEPNPGWWDAARKTHNLTRVVFQPLRSDATRLAALVSGQVDLILSCPLQDIERIRRIPGLRVLEQPSLRTLMLGMNVSSTCLEGAGAGAKNPLRDIRVREALYRAIDIETIVSKLMRGRADPAGAIVPQGINGYDPRLNGRLSHDPKTSRRLLSEAGYPRGFTVRLDCPNDRYINDEEICTSLVAMLGKVGVRVNLRAQTKARYLQTILSSKPDLFLLGWASADTLDAQSFLKDILHTPGGAKGSFNIGGYSNPRVDALEPLAAREPDPEKRRDLLYRAFKIHKEEIGHIPLHTQHIVWAAREGVEALQIPLDAIWLRFVRVR
jgi:peptide/nickel transport system substrate-binding protein